MRSADLRSGHSRLRDRLAASSLALLILCLAWPTTAAACSNAGDQRQLLHKKLPALPEGVAAAEVVVLGPAGFRNMETDARIVTLIRGPAAVQLIRFSAADSCEAKPRVGDRGFIFGEVGGVVGDLLLMRPVPGPRWSEILEQDRISAISE